MVNIYKIAVVCCLLVAVFTTTALASVESGYKGNQSKGYSFAYPIVNTEDKKVTKEINNDIEKQMLDLEKKIKNHVYSKVDMTYYEKYEDDNIVSLMFYVNAKAKFTEDIKLNGYTITYDKHTGERVPMKKYLNISLEQLQQALNNSRAYAVDGLDNGVNLAKKIPYVSTNYFICHDGSIGLLYQPGDLMDIKDGACKIVISPETINEVNHLNN